MAANLDEFLKQANDELVRRRGGGQEQAPSLDGVLQKAGEELKARRAKEASVDVDRHLQARDEWLASNSNQPGPRGDHGFDAPKTIDPDEGGQSTYLGRRGADLAQGWEQAKAAPDAMRLLETYNSAAEADQRIQDLQSELEQGPANDFRAEQIRNQIEGWRKDRDQSAQRMAEYAKALKEHEDELAEFAVNPVMKRIAEAETAEEAVDFFFANPVEATSAAIAQSAAYMAGSVAGGMAGGALAGPAGFAAGTGAASGLGEYGFTIADKLREYGTDLTDPESIKSTFQNHGEEIKRDAKLRAAIIVMADTLGGGLASTRVMPRGGRLTDAAEGVVQTTGQAASGAAGEAGAQYATEGRFRPGEVLLEGAAEIPGGLVETGASTLSGSRRQGQRQGVKTSDEGSTEDITRQIKERARTAQSEVDTALGDITGERPGLLKTPIPANPGQFTPEVQPTGTTADIVPPETQPVAAQAAEEADKAEGIARSVQDDGAIKVIMEPINVTSDAPVDQQGEAGQDQDTAKSGKVEGREIVEAPISELQLSEEVPQFKADADESGVVDPLGGSFDRTGVAPIQVWVRNDGTMEVITGRHRLDLARRSGEETIPAQYHYESDGFTADDARAIDGILNIRDGQGEVKDYVSFFQNAEFDREQAEQEGLLARAKGRRGWEIAESGTDLLVEAHQAGEVTDQAAHSVATAAPGDKNKQAFGLQQIKAGKPISETVNLMQAVDAMGGGEQADMFGLDDTAMQQAEALAKAATRRQREVSDNLSAIRGAAKRPDKARAQGVDVRDPEAVNRRIDELEAERARWQNWATDPELVDQLRADAGLGDGFELNTQTSEELRQAEASQREAEKAEAEADRKAQADAEADMFGLTGSDLPADANPAQADLVEASRQPAGSRDTFTPTHELPSGEQVAATDEPGVYVNAEGVEYVDDNATPLKGRQGERPKPQPQTRPATPRQDLVYRNDGQPYKNRNGASLAIRQRKLGDAEPVEVEGGWAIQPSGAETVTSDTEAAGAPADMGSDQEPPNYAAMTWRELRDEAKRRGVSAKGSRRELQNRLMDRDEIDAAGAQTDTEPSDGQKEAGNYRKGRVRLWGRDVSIENPQGSTRSGTDADGTEWSTTLAHDYGDINGTTAADGDNLDVFLGPDSPEDAPVFVIDQVNEDGSFDEHKIMAGFPSEQAAREGYLANYEEGWQGLGNITRMVPDEFRAWLDEGDHTQAVGDTNAQGLRGDAREVQARGDEREGRGGEGGSNPQLEAPGQPGDREAQEALAAELHSGEVTQDEFAQKYGLTEEELARGRRFGREAANRTSQNETLSVLTGEPISVSQYRNEVINEFLADIANGKRVGTQVDALGNTLPKDAAAVVGEEFTGRPDRGSIADLEGAYPAAEQTETDKATAPEPEQPEGQSLQQEIDAEKQRLREIINSDELTGEQRATEIETARENIQYLEAQLGSKQRAGARAEAGKQYAADVYKAARKALDSGQTLYVQTNTKATKITPNRRDALRWNERNQQIEVQRGKNWDAVEFGTLDRLAAQVGVSNPQQPETDQPAASPEGEEYTEVAYAGTGGPPADRIYGFTEMRPDGAENYFGGVFASRDVEAARSHGKTVQTFRYTPEALLEHDDLRRGLLYDDWAETTLKEVVEQDLNESVTEEELYDLAEFVAEDKSVMEGDEFVTGNDRLAEILGYDNTDEMDWRLQGVAGQIARRRGYGVLELPDEHGTSLLVLGGDGVQINPDQPQRPGRAGPTTPESQGAQDTGSPEAQPSEERPAQTVEEYTSQIEEGRAREQQVAEQTRSQNQALQDEYGTEDPVDDLLQAFEQDQPMPSWVARKPYKPHSAGRRAADKAAKKKADETGIPHASVRIVDERESIPQGYAVVRLPVAANTDSALPGRAFGGDGMAEAGVTSGTQLRTEIESVHRTEATPEPQGEQVVSPERKTEAQELEERADQVEREAEELPIPVHLDDLPMSEATAAHAGTSMTPERRGRQRQIEYVEDMLDLYRKMEPLADTEEKQAMLKEELARYKQGYLKRLRASLVAQSRTMSAMVAGPSNFPVRRNAKRNETARKRTDDLLEWRERARKAIRKKLTPERQPVSSTDPEAVDKLRNQLAERERYQETMKSANRVVRKKGLTDEQRIEQIQGVGLSETQARELLQPDFAGRTGFPDYALKNNNGQIKRLRERIAEIEARQETAEQAGGAVEVPFDGGTVELDYAGGYVRVRHDEKPDQQVRAKLKGNSFRWAPKEGVWRRKINNAAKQAAEKITGAPISESEPRFSFAGEQAQTADRYALETAQERIQAGEDPEVVRRETGWHQGDDGLWRFEISDDQASLKPALEALGKGPHERKTIDHLDYRAHEDGTYSLLLTPEGATRTSDFVELTRVPFAVVDAMVPESVSRKIRRGQGEADVGVIGPNLDPAMHINESFEFEGFNALPLDQALDHPQLFAAYPGLRDVFVQVDPNLRSGGEFAMREDGNNVIRIGKSQQLSALMHEVQHGIQNIEGFASGGSPGAMDVTEQTVVNPDFMSALEQWNDILRAEGYPTDKLFNPADITMNDPDLLIEQLEMQGGWLQDKRGEHVSEFDEQFSGVDPYLMDAYEAYRRLAGEIEARNVQKRLNMTPDERAARSPEETRDIPASGAIVMFNGEFMENAPANATERPKRQSQGLPRSRVQAAVSNLMQDWQGAPETVVVQSVSDLPAPLYSAIDEAGAHNEVRGIYYGGRAYVVADNTPSEAHAEETVLHEVVGHHGLRELLGRDHAKLLDDIYLSYGKSGLKDIADRYGFDLNDKTQRRQAAEEKLAHIAQADPKSRFWDRFVRMFRDWMRKQGFTLKLSNSEIRDLITRARRFVEGGEQVRSSVLSDEAAFQRGDDTADNTPMFQRVPVDVGRENGNRPTEATKRRNKEAFSYTAHMGVDDAGNPVEVETSHPSLQEQGKLKRWAKRLFTKEGQLTPEAFARHIESHGIKNEDELTAQFATADFIKAARRAYRKVAYDRIPEADREKMNDYLAGKEVDIPAEVADKLDVMRAVLDNLSARSQKMLLDEVKYALESVPVEKREKMVGEIRKAVRGDEAAVEAIAEMSPRGSFVARKMRTFLTIEQNKGEYLHRSYRVFDDPKWADKVRKDEATMEAARAYLREQIEEDKQKSQWSEKAKADHVEGIINSILDTDKTDIAGFMFSGQLGQKDLSTLKRRKEIAPEIRALMGEHKDPRVNFARSLSKMSHMVANHHFLAKVREDGLAVYLSKEQSGPMSQEITAWDEETMIPLAGLYATKEFAEGLRHAVESDPAGEWTRAYRKFNVSVKYGKAQPLDSVIYTPIGPTTMGQLSVGDEVCGANGRTRVAGIFPQGEIDVYRVTFSDGSTTKASGEHLWEIDGPSKSYNGVFTTEDIAAFPEYVKRKRQIAVPVGVAEFESKETPIDPYLLGAILGDGSVRSTTLRFSTDDEEIVDAIRETLPDGLKIESPDSWHRRDYSITATTRSESKRFGNSVTDSLKSLGVWGSLANAKFVPDVYKYNSQAVRMSLMRGLLDTDGWVVRDGQPALCTVSRQLALDAMEVAESLGATVLWREKTPSCNGKEGQVAYELKFRVKDAKEWFGFPRKSDAASTKTKPVKRTLVSIEHMGKEECQCIMVDDPRHLYMTDRFILTHNTVLSPTTMARNFLSASLFTVMNGHFDYRHMTSAASHTWADLGSNDNRRYEYLRKLTRLGVLHDNPRSAELMAALDDAADMDTNKGNLGSRALKSTLNAATRAYRAGDDFWKIIGFENEKQAFLKHGMTEAEAEKMAADRVRNGYPTYSMVPEAIRMLRRSLLIGTFVSFPWEVIRTTGHQFRFVMEDMQAGRTEMATRRMLGMSMAMASSYAVSVVSMAMLGIDDEEDEAIRELAAPWQKDSMLAYLGNTEDGKMRYLDLSHLDPYTYLKTPLSALANGNYETAQEKLGAGLWSFLKPFLGPEITATVIGELAFNTNWRTGAPIYDEYASITEQGKQAFEYAYEALRPGVASQVERTLKAFHGDMTTYGKEYNVPDEMLAWVGFRLTTSDPEVSLRFRAYDLSERMRQAGRPVYRALRNPNPDVDIETAVEQTYSRWEEGFKNIHEAVTAARVAGAEDNEIRRELVNGGVAKKYIPYMMNGRVAPWLPSTESASNALESVARKDGSRVSQRDLERRRLEVQREVMQKAREVTRP